MTLTDVTRTKLKSTKEINRDLDKVLKNNMFKKFAQKKYIYTKYLKYLFRHKWYVMLACFRYKLYWQGIKHDWSKFLPSELIPYATYFYASTAEEKDAASFDAAWLKHQHRNAHHHQHWILRGDHGLTSALEMPKKYVYEMVADWVGAGQAITGKIDVKSWYNKNKHKIELHKESRKLVEKLLKDW